MTFAPPTPLARRLKLHYAAAFAASKKSFSEYLDYVVIDSVPKQRRFGLVREPWQKDLFDAVAPAVEQAAGVRTGYKGPLNFWFTLPKGHDKTTGEGRVLNWLLGFGRRRPGLNLYGAATDRDQAKLLLDAMSAEASLNPWLRQRLVFNRTNALGPGGRLTILASDAASNAGLRPDVVVIDEVTCWRKPDLYTQMVGGAAKRVQCVLIVITNAGVRGSWQWDRLQEARADPKNWHVYEAPGPLATWMSADRIASLRRQLPPGEAARLYDNRWIDPGEDRGYLTRADVDLCEKLGRGLDLRFRDRGERGVRYFAAVDYGPKRDRTALCVGHLDRKYTAVVVDQLVVWQGAADAPVRLDAVERWMLDAQRKFNDPLFVIDPYQMEAVRQRLEGRCRVEAFEFRGGKGNWKMAETLRSLVCSGKVAWYPGAGDVVEAGKAHTLGDELVELVVRPMSYGYRFDHTSGHHDDRAVALGMTAMLAVRDGEADPPPPPAAVAAAPVEVASLEWGKRKGVFGMGEEGRR